VKKRKFTVAFLQKITDLVSDVLKIIDKIKQYEKHNIFT